MCGIVGVIPKGSYGFDKKTEDSFYQMLFADTLRGDDSTGMILVEKDSSFGIMKEGYAAPWVIDQMKNSKQGKAMWTQGKALIGHNRAATRGVVNDENAHPFVVNDSFAMVHNGTLHAHKHLADVTVDSEALTIHLETVLNGEWNKEKFEEEIGKVNGAFAIAAYSQNNHSVYLTRNSERPLHYVETTEGFFWASEYHMLAWILLRNGIHLKDNLPKAIKEHTLIKIDLDTNKLEEIEYSPKKATPVVHTTTTGKSTKVKNYTAQVSAIGGTNRVSKQQFKVLKRRWLNKPCDFWADDFIEKDFPNTLAKGSTDIILLGEIDEFNFDHNVQAEFDIRDCHVPNKFLGHLYRGFISTMEFDRNTGYVTVIVDSIQQVPKSDLIIDAAYIQRELDKAEAAKQQSTFLQ